jgi:phenylacetate-CoA ligase
MPENTDGAADPVSGGRSTPSSRPAPKSPVELSVLVPCFNEEANLPELAQRVVEVFRRGKIAGELILVDDGSRDRSRAVMEDLASRYPDVRPVFHPENRGIAASWSSACAAARGEQVCILDADLQYQPEDILRLRRELLHAHVDIVQGWRSPVGRVKGPRYYYSRGFNSLLNLLFRMKLRDNKSGFFICSREVFEDLLSYSRSYHYWQSFVMVSAHSKGYSTRQLETLFEPRRAGESFLSSFPFTVMARSFRDLVTGFREYRMGPRSKDPLRGYLDRVKSSRKHSDRSMFRRAYWRAYLILFRLTHWMMTGQVGRQLDDLRRSQWLSGEELRELQGMKLRRLLRHAYRNVPYYREKFDEAGITPEEIRTVDDLSRVPFLTKSDVRAHLYFDIMSENHAKSDVLKIATSGSTGEPFVCFVDREQLEFRWAATLRSVEWTGYRFGDRQTRLWHQTLGMTGIQILREKLDALLSRRKFIPAWEMSDATMEQFIRSIESHQPVLLDGYAESFNYLARYLKGRGRLNLNARGIISSAQTLPDGSRKVIEEAFGCKVFDKYGSREFSGIAYECEAHDGHHVVAEGYIVEILRDGRPAKPGEIGEVVITDLNNYCLPFIRYRIGDLAEAMDNSRPCACGRGLPRVGKIEGRVQSIVVGAEGRYIPGAFFAHLLKDYDHVIRQYQIVQEKRGEILFRVVKGGRFSDSALNEIKGVLKQYLGAGMVIHVKIEESIKMIRTGKHLACASTLGIDILEGRSEIHVPKVGATP